MSKERPNLALLFFFFVLFATTTCKAQKIAAACAPSSCGDLHDISYPFRLKTDPKQCGDSNFELECENNRTVMSFNSMKFNVLAITYSNFSIRVADPGLDNDKNCSFPSYNNVNYGEFPFVYSNVISYNIPVLFIKCRNPITSPSSRFVDNSFCRNETAVSNSSRAFSYVAVGDGLTIYDVEESCGVDMITRVSTFGPIKERDSLQGIHEILAYGFEFSWFQVFCQGCDSKRGGFCSIKNNAVSCHYYCSENIPISELSLECSLQYYWVFIFWYGLIASGALVALRFLIGFSCLMFLIVRQWQKRHLSADDTIEQFLQGPNNLSPIKYSYSQVKKMTENFKEKLGEGGHGTVFKGKLRSGPYVAVKIMEKTMASEQDFVSEVATIGRIHHVNIVQLVGFCTEGSNRALIYEFMPNGSLDKHIFPTGKNESPSLSYERMFEISLGVARGIDYLHRGCDMRILHFDIKPHNILLDEKFNPKISDFGLAKLYPADESFVSLPAARGTRGYMAPELFYKNIGGVSYKADVYSFGMLLMEMASRRENRNPGAENVSQIYFPSWAYDQFRAGKDIDMANVNAAERKLVRKMIIVAMWCIQMKPVDRLPMHKVVEMLEGDDDCVRMPPKPFVAPREMADDDEDEMKTYMGMGSSEGVLSNSPSLPR